MPYNSRSEVFGDLIFKFNVIYPSQIDSKHFDKLKNILPETMFDKVEELSNKYKLETYTKSHNFDNENEQQNGPGCQQQ